MIIWFARTLAVVMLVTPASAWAWHFAEGFSSAMPDSPANIHSRAFTIYGGQEACDISPTPAEFRVRPASIKLKVGERILRSDLTIEAYDMGGNFLPSIPIVVQILGSVNLLISYSYWDYAEAVGVGKGKMLIGWRCSSEHPIQAWVEITVTAE